MPRKRRKKNRRPRWYRRGEQIYQKLVRQNDPLALADLTEEERLMLIFGQRAGVRELLTYAKGDLLNLVGMDLRELEMIPGVGPALAAKVAALLFEFGLFRQRVSAVPDGEDYEGRDHSP